MSFAETFAESRERFSEALQLINLLAAEEGERTTPATNTNKALKGLALVSIYAAVERSINSAVEQAISEISSHATPSAKCSPEILSIFHYSRIQAVRDCGSDKTIKNSIDLFGIALSRDPVWTTTNPFTLMLQNVDAKTMILIAELFGISGYTISGPASGRLNNLRERRNAVAHGREAASIAGERFTIPEIRNVYTIADSETTRFIDTLKSHCEARRYITNVA